MTESKEVYRVKRATNYSRGAQKERDLIAKLEGLGYSCVRSAGSHGPADVVAWDSRHIRLIQVKAEGLSSNEISSALNALAEMEKPGIAQCELWQWLVKGHKGRWWRHWLQDGVCKLAEVP